MKDFNRETLEMRASQGLVVKENIFSLRGGNGCSHIYKDLKPNDPRSYETGCIVLEKGASIGMHRHDRDSETYTVLVGAVEICGKLYYAGSSVTCFEGESHNAINRNDGDSILDFSKSV